MSADDFSNDPFDSPQNFEQAAEQLVLYCPELTLGAAARALSWLAQAGLIHSAAHFNAVCQDYADRLSHCETAADELVHQLHGDRRGPHETA